MSFRKRNVVIAQSDNGTTGAATEKVLPQGVRPSPLDGRPTISTGTSSLDALLAGHAGLVMGCSLMIEESGTTDFAGAVLRYYAAEGVLQGHQVHVLGMDETWGRELPGLAEPEGKMARRAERNANTEDAMKIAWRYERLGEHRAGARDRSTATALKSSSESGKGSIFCHEFDLSKRLVLPTPTTLAFVPIVPQLSISFKDAVPSASPFSHFLQHLTTKISLSPSSSVHRVIIPTLLSPALYPSTASLPEHILQFMHGLRAILWAYPTQLTAIIAVPITLHPRSSGLTRWMELLSDGVLELAPFPSSMTSNSTLAVANRAEELPQGMLKIHRLPIFHEKGGGGGEASAFSDDLSFSLSRRKGLVIKPYSLPPVEGEADGHQIGHGEKPQNSGAGDIEF